MQALERRVEEEVEEEETREGGENVVRTPAGGAIDVRIVNSFATSYCFFVMGVRLNRAPFVISGRGPDARGPSAAGGTSPGSTAAVAFVDSVTSR